MYYNNKYPNTQEDSIMKLMKKFGLLVALALIVTIGGVYATWNYSGQTGINSSHEHLNSNMADYVAGENAYGNIRILDNDMDIIIDDANNNHVAELVITGDMVFIFTPYNNAPDEVKNNGIGMQWMIHQTTDYIYDFGTDSTTDDVAIYTINQTVPVIFAGANVMKIDSTNVSNVFGRTVTNDAACIGTVDVVFVYGSACGYGAGVGATVCGD